MVLSKEILVEMMCGKDHVQDIIDALGDDVTEAFTKRNACIANDSHKCNIIKLNENIDNTLIRYNKFVNFITE